MKTFEEKWTAWLDGELSGKELVEFEASLPDKAAAEAEKHDAHKLGALLKEQLSAHALSNEDFFSHQLRERIVRESGPSREPSLEGSTWWTVRRLFLTGVASLALFVICRRGDPGQEPGRTVAISDADSERAGRSGGQPECDDLNVRNKRRQGNSAVGRGIAVITCRLRSQVTVHAKLCSPPRRFAGAGDECSLRGANHPDCLERPRYR